MQPLGFVGTVALGLLLLAAGSRGFIRVVDQKFVDEDCNEFLWVGANTCVIVMIRSHIPWLDIGVACHGMRVWLYVGTLLAGLVVNRGQARTASPTPPHRTPGRWRLLEAEAGVYGNDSTASDTLMNQAQELNITVLRIFATGVTPQLPMKLDPSEAGDWRGAIERSWQPHRLQMSILHAHSPVPTHNDGDACVAG